MRVWADPIPALIDCNPGKVGRRPAADARQAPTAAFNRQAYTQAPESNRPPRKHSKFELNLPSQADQQEHKRSNFKCSSTFVPTHWKTRANQRSSIHVRYFFPRHGTASQSFGRAPPWRSYRASQWIMKGAQLSVFNKVKCSHSVSEAMMPLAPTPVMAVPSKPKIGFSIDSIVGGPPKHASPPLASPGSPSPVASPRSPSPRPLLRPSALPAVFPSPELKRLPYLEAQSHHHQFLAHFQGAALAAALAHQQQGFGGPLPPHPPPHPAAPVPRESYQLYPWLINRHGRIFPHRFPGGMFQK